MPELPEVETVKKVIEPLIKGKTINKIDIFNNGTIITPLNDFKSFVLGETVLSLGRKGKFLIFNLTNNKAILSHLRMEGKYFFYEEQYKRSKHDMVSYEFSDGTTLVYNDVRKFGIIGSYYQDDLLTKSPLKTLGKEPFDLDSKDLFNSFKGIKQNIKEALLDQSKIAGLGNIYVDETCFASSIHPKTRASYISQNECNSILNNSRRILNEAIKEGGSTIKSFHPSKGVDGRMQNRLKVYGHENEPCPVCGTKLRKIVVGGRGTTFCPLCQRKKYQPFVVAVTGQIHVGKSTVTDIFEKNGFYKMDCDKIVHDLYDSEKVAKQISNLFSPSFISSNKVDRKKLAQFISTNKEAKLQLTNLIHPQVATESKKILSSIDAPYVVFEVPLLIGSGLEDLCDYVVLVTSNDDNKKLRLLKEGKDADTLLKINQNYRLKETFKIATKVVENDSSINSLEKEVNKIIKEIKG